MIHKIYDTTDPVKNPWWKDGVRFECQGSGRCCTSRGTHGFVYLTPADRTRLAEYHKMTRAQFTLRYCGSHDGLHYLKPENPETPSPEDEVACRFLDDKRCTIYEARPTQCRTWPFWPEHMGAKAWDTEVTKFCPGVGKGRLYSADEIRELLKQDPVLGEK